MHSKRRSKRIGKRRSKRITKRRSKRITKRNYRRPKRHKTTKRNTNKRNKIKGGGMKEGYYPAFDENWVHRQNVNEIHWVKVAGGILNFKQMIENAPGLDPQERIKHVREELLKKVGVCKKYPPEFVKVLSDKFQGLSLVRALANNWYRVVEKKQKGPGRSDPRVARGDRLRYRIDGYLVDHVYDADPYITTEPVTHAPIPLDMLFHFPSQSIRLMQGIRFKHEVDLFNNKMEVDTTITKSMSKGGGGVDTTITKSTSKGGGGGNPDDDIPVPVPPPPPILDHVGCYNFLDNGFSSVDGVYISVMTIPNCKQFLDEHYVGIKEGKNESIFNKDKYVINTLWDEITDFENETWSLKDFEEWMDMYDVTTKSDVEEMLSTAYIVSCMHIQNKKVKKIINVMTTYEFTDWKNSGPFWYHGLVSTEISKELRLSTEPLYLTH
jgi:hypothetical protein